MKKVGQYRILGETRDDAAGECFDKAARILGLGYPGGPVIAVEAAKFKVHPVKSAESGAKQFNRVESLRSKVELPRPMIYQKNYDFSFSGLKTAVLYKVRDNKQNSKRVTLLAPQLKLRQAKSEKYIQAMCAEVQQAIIDVLIYKTLKAAKDYKAKSIILGGGVAANEELRKQFKENIKKEIPNTKYLIPNTNFCTDNAAMTAITAYFHKNQIKNRKKIKAESNLRIS
jgi:N6-L-threonylcarbamoyladenine synthase